MPQGKRLRIFIFDDDSTITRLLQLVLSGQGHHVQTFSDPTFCDIYRKDVCTCPQDYPCADVVICDIMMPKINGIELLRRQRQRGCKAPIENMALMSARTDAEQRSAVTELGCHFFKKPFRLDTIQNWVNECAERIPQGRPLAQLGS